MSQYDLETTTDGNGTATVSPQSFQRADRVEVTAEAVDGELWDAENGETTDVLEATLESVGERATFEAAAGGAEVRIVAVAVSGQGEALIYEETLEL